MKVLIAHHLETMWGNSFVNYGTSFDKEAEKLVDHLEASDYDLVILTRFEEWELEPEHHYAGLSHLINHVYPYGYGWEEGMIDGEEGETWTEGGSHSNIVAIDDWMHDLKRRGAKVDLCGAFDGECIEDITIALEAIGIEVNRLDHMIV